MKKTKNLNLDLFGIALVDKQQKFRTWRLAMCGEDDSNMIKIDNKVGQIDSQIATKADKAYVDTQLATKAPRDVATTVVNGLMSSTDKTKLDGIVIGTEGNINEDISSHNLDATSHPNILTALSEKVKINNTSTNVNFSEKKVVQDGLIIAKFSPSTRDVIGIVNISRPDFYVHFNIIKPSVSGLDYILKLSRYNIGIQFASNGKLLIVNTENGSIKATSNYTYDVATSHDVVFYRNENNYTLITQKEVLTATNDNEKSVGNNSLNNSNYCYIYTRQLSNVEIRHNSQVLSTTSSIHAINDYPLATDTSHVVDKSNTSQETINRTFYKQFCKEFTNDGSDITVNNGMDGYLLSGEIKGNTVKNYITGISKTHSNSTNKSANIPIGEIKEGGTYKFIFKVTSTVGNPPIIINETPQKSLTYSGTGIYELEYSLTSVISNTLKQYIQLTIAQAQLDAGNSVSYELLGVFDTSVTKNQITSILPFGLNSTKAIIQNNGLQYPIYASEADKTSNIPISLGGVGSIYDTLTLNEDGSGVLARNTLEETITSSGWTYRQDLTVDGVACKKYSKTISNNYVASVKGTKSNLISNIYRVGNSTDGSSISTDTLGIATYYNSNNVLYLIIPSTDTIVDFTVRYQLATPVTTTIPKELMPVILTTKVNTIGLASAVKPSSLKVVLPTTDDVYKSYLITLLNGYIQTASTPTPILELTNTGLIRMQLDVTTPTSNINTTIFALPTEIRPVVNTKIPVFVNGVCQLATVNASTGNITLLNTPSANANIYIKTDFKRDNQ